MYGKNSKFFEIGFSKFAQEKVEMDLSLEVYLVEKINSYFALLCIHARK